MIAANGVIDLAHIRSQIQRSTKSLEEWLGSDVLTTSQTARVALGILNALIARQEQGRGLHGALDPGRIRVDQQGLFHLGNHHSLTRGALELAAPERVNGSDWDERADVYAVANLLCTLRTEVLPADVQDTLFSALSVSRSCRPRTVFEFRRQLSRSFTAYALQHCALKIHADDVDIDTLVPRGSNPLTTQIRPSQWALALVGCGLAGSIMGALFFLVAS